LQKSPSSCDLITGIREEIFGSPAAAGTINFLQIHCQVTGEKIFIPAFRYREGANIAQAFRDFRRSRFVPERPGRPETDVIFPSTSLEAHPPGNQLIPVIPDNSDAFGICCRRFAVRRRGIKSVLISSWVFFFADMLIY